MSHANGVVVRNGQILGFFEYDGTSDIVISTIWQTQKELDENWRSDIWNKCKCDEPPQEVILYTDYGKGFHWQAKACLRCKAIVENLLPFDSEGVECFYGLPQGITTELFCG